MLEKVGLCHSLEVTVDLNLYGVKYFLKVNLKSIMLELIHSAVKSYSCQKVTYQGELGHLNEIASAYTHQMFDKVFQ